MMKVEDTTQLKVHTYYIKVAHCDGIVEELFITRVVVLMEVLWVIVLRGIVVAKWS